MSRKKQCTSVPCIERNRNAITHSNTLFTKQLVALSFAFLWLSFLSASSFDFVIPINNSHATHPLISCDSISSFSSDTLKNFYIDTNPRNSIITLCPRDGSQRLGVLFREFDLVEGDTLFVYDGVDTNAPLIGKASGQGIEAAFGGDVFVSFNRNTNMFSCLTFSFQTNGDRESGTGWIADIKCADRIAEFVPPILPSQQLACGAESIDISIPAAELIVECSPLRFDSAMVRIIETTSGFLCEETCLSFEAGMQFLHPFGVGSYTVEYSAVLDTSITNSFTFEVTAPDLICKQEVIINTNTSCEITIFPEMVVENYCFPIQDILHYNILIRDNTGTILASGSTLTETYPSLPASMITCGDVGYHIEIQQVYTAKQGSPVCATDNVTAICSSPLIILDQSVPFFTEGPRTDTIFSCDITLDRILASVTLPTASDACGNTTVTLNNTRVLADGVVTCSSQSSYALDWLVADDCGNSATRTDTLRVVRPNISQFINLPVNIMVDCNTPLAGTFPGTGNTPIGILSGFQINGQFQVTDTILISENNTTCDLQLQVRDIRTDANCGGMRQRIFELIDLCDPQEAVVLVDTQSVQIIDTIAPIFTSCMFSALTDAEQIVLPANSCQLSLDFPIPQAIDNCDDQPIVREFAVQELVNGEWSTKAISIFQTSFGIGTFRVCYEATDNCGTVSNRDTCYRYFTINDTTPPIFAEGPRTDTMFSCDITLGRILGSLTPPAVSDACGNTIVTLENTSAQVSGVVTCNSQPSYTLVWLAIDDSGNSVRRTDTIRVIRPNISQLINLPVDIMVACNEPIDGTFPGTGNTPIGILSGLQVDGQFQVTDTIFLDENNTTCDFQLQVRDIGTSTNGTGTNCGGIPQRIFELIDLCDPQGAVVLVDTQSIQIIDTIAPTISCLFSALADAEQIVLPANSCQLNLNFPAAAATDNCDDQPTVREFAVEELVNGVWSTIGMSLSQTSFGIGTFRVGYEATDNCGPISNRDTCYRYFTVSDTVAPFFAEGPRIDTLFSCDITLDRILANVTPPAASDACGNTIVTLESTNPLVDGVVTCSSQPSFTLNWLAIDDSDNLVRRTDTVRVIRPNISQLINVPTDIMVVCNEPIDVTFARTGNTSIGILSGLQVDGQFQVTDTIFLDENNTTCDFQLQIRDIGTSTSGTGTIGTGTNCGGMPQRIFELIDLCDPQGAVVLVDTQSILIIDTIAPTISCMFSALANAEQIVLPANSCQLSLDFPVPEAVDDCDEEPIVSEFAVEELINMVWSIKAMSLSQTSFGPGTFRVGYEATDNCGTVSNRDTCYRYFTVNDTIAPIAICQTNQEIALGPNGRTTFSALEFNNNSTDNCGIEQILVKGSNCLDGQMRLDSIQFLRDSINLSEFSTEIIFECCDLFTDVEIELLVIDSSGNFNICSTIVNPVDQVQPICMALPPVTRNCDEFETTDIGRPTDLDGDNDFDPEEWLALTATQAFFFNQQFGDPSELCMDNSNCIPPIIEQEYQLIEGTCRTLSVIRRYRAVDRSGNESPYVEQTIDIIYQPDWVITFPADEFTNCDVDKIELPTSPVQEGTCDDFVWTFTDSLIQFESGNIQQIIRTYSVVNQCLTNGDDQWLPIDREVDEDNIVRSPNIITASQFPLEDHFTYVQIIRFVDNDAPFLVLGEIDSVLIGKGDAAPFEEEDQTFGSSPLECDDNRTFTVFGRDCNELSTEGLLYNWQFLQNGTLLDTGTDPSFLQTVLPDTTYTVIWEVTDEFGNQTDTTVQYQFIDGVPPTPRCARGVIATIDTFNRMVVVQADSLDAGSFDNCNDQSELNFFLLHESLGIDTPSVLSEVQMLPTQITFTCADVGIVELLVFVVDATGNFNSCPIQIEIQAPIEIDCDETMVSGNLTDRFGVPIMNATVDILSATNNRITSSDEAGNFEIMLPTNNAYTIVPSNNKKPLNGVSTFDLVLISKHIIGVDIFTSPYQYVAADVNKSGMITAYDMVVIRQMILGIISQFPNNESWRFINKNFQFQANNPLAEMIEESYTIDPLSTDNVYMDFIGVKIGDINGDATSAYTFATARNYGTTFSIYTPELKVERGKTYTIPFYAPQLENITGFQATFKFNDLILTNKIGGIVTPDNIHGWRKGQEGFLTTSWHSLLSHDNNTVLFSLTFEATTDGHLNELLSITSDPTPAEAYSFSGHWLDCTLSFQSPDSMNILDFGSIITSSPSLPQEYTTPVLDVEGGAFKVFQNIPNPFATTTIINFYLPEEALTALSVFNIHGQNILQTTQHYSKGTNQLKFVSDQLPNGTYFYQVATPFGVATHKMIIAK